MENFNTYELNYTDTENQREDIAHYIGCDITDVKL